MRRAVSNAHSLAEIPCANWPHKLTHTFLMCRAYLVCCVLGLLSSLLATFWCAGIDSGIFSRLFSCWCSWFYPWWCCCHEVCSGARLLLPDRGYPSAFWGNSLLLCRMCWAWIATFMCFAYFLCTLESILFLFSASVKTPITFLNRKNIA